MRIYLFSSNYRQVGKPHLKKKKTFSFRFGNSQCFRNSWKILEIQRIRPLCYVKLLSHVQLFVTPWTAACQAPLFMGFPRQEFWSGLPFPSPRDLPDPGIEPVSPALAGGFFATEPPGKPHCSIVAY